MYPQRVDLNEENIKKLINLFKGSYKQIVEEMTTATNFGVANRKRILTQVEKILKDLGVNVDDFIKKEIPEYYKTGAAQGVKQLENIGAEVTISTGFNQVHKDYIMALIDDTSRAFGESLSGVGRSANLILGKAFRDAMTQKIAKGITSGEALKEVRDQIVLILKEQGLSALKDKSGRSWDLDAYAEMLFRTKVVEARNRGMVNRMAENGYDLVQVSAHSGTCDICASWQGKILSITGQTEGYDTVADAEADGLFHPNCRHALNTLIPKLARETEAYDNGA